MFVYIGLQSPIFILLKRKPYLYFPKWTGEGYPNECANDNPPYLYWQTLLTYLNVIFHSIAQCLAFWLIKLEIAVRFQRGTVFFLFLFF